MRGKRPAPRATSRTRPVRGLAREVLYAEVMVAPSTYGRAVSPETTALAPLLLADHEMLRTRLEGLLSAFHAGPGDEAAKLWFEFDRELQAHFDLEEQYVLPDLDPVAPAEAAALREEHADLRRRLERLGTGVDLHLTREEAVAEFADALAAHTQREQVVLHAFAERHLSERDQAAIRALLLDARGRFVARRESPA